jgi:hypothetical protein
VVDGKSKTRTYGDFGMTNLRQAAEQALKALESGLAFDIHSDVLQNLRAALEQQQAEPVAWDHLESSEVIAKHFGVKE